MCYCRQVTLLKWPTLAQLLRSPVALLSVRKGSNILLQQKHPLINCRYQLMEVVLNNDCEMVVCVLCVIIMIISASLSINIPSISTNDVALSSILSAFLQNGILIIFCTSHSYVQHTDHAQVTSIAHIHAIHHCTCCYLYIFVLNTLRSNKEKELVLCCCY